MVSPTSEAAVPPPQPAKESPSNETPASGTQLPTLPETTTYPPPTPPTPPSANILEPTRNDPSLPPEPVLTQSDAPSVVKTPRSSRMPSIAAIRRSSKGASQSEASQPSPAIDAVFERIAASDDTPDGGNARASLFATLKNKSPSFKRNVTPSEAHEPNSDHASTQLQLSNQSPATQQTETGTVTQPGPTESSSPTTTAPRQFLTSMKTKRNSLQQRFAKPSTVVAEEPVMVGTATVVSSHAVRPTLIVPTRPPRKAAAPDAEASRKDSLIESFRARRQAASQSKASPAPASGPANMSEPAPAMTGANSTQPAAAPPRLIIPTPPPRKTKQADAAPVNTKASIRKKLKAKKMAALRKKTGPVAKPKHTQADAVPASTSPPVVVIQDRLPGQSDAAEPVSARRSKRDSFVGGLKAKKEAVFKSKSTQPGDSSSQDPEPGTGGAPSSAASQVLIIPTRPPRKAATPAASTCSRLPFLSAKRADQPPGCASQAAAQSGALAYPAPSTNPLFPTLPTYGPAMLKNRIKWALLQTLSAIMSTLGISAIAASLILQALVRAVVRRIRRQPKQPRPFLEEEKRRAELRKLDEISWMRRELQAKSIFPEIANAAEAEYQATMASHNGYIPTEGGPDKHLVDVAYYAKRVGLNSEEVQVQTEDGHVLALWHVYDPREYTPMTRAQRMVRGPENINEIRAPSRVGQGASGVGHKAKQKYPVLMIPGLLQSAGAFCTSDEHSLAFWLCKQGFDIWLGNMRDFRPEHVEFKHGDPKMWNWDIRHMATLDLPALTARVLSETTSSKLALVAHSQGTAASLIAVSKQQRPGLSAHISSLCMLAPAAYSGSHFNRKAHLKALRTMPPKLARRTLGVKSFFSGMHLATALKGRVQQKYLGRPAYHVQKSLFGWTDARWERALRDRHFIFAPTSMSATAMLWWSGFARHGSILAPASQVKYELEEDVLQDYFRDSPDAPGRISEELATTLLENHVKNPMQVVSWFDASCPPIALWVPAEDRLCDGLALMNRFERGREPDARVVSCAVLEGYGHLDVVWAVDVVKKVGLGVREAVWSTVGEEARAEFRVPVGCEEVEAWIDDRTKEVQSEDGDEEEDEDEDEEEEEAEDSE